MRRACMARLMSYEDSSRAMAFAGELRWRWLLRLAYAPRVARSWDGERAFSPWRSS